MKFNGFEGVVDQLHLQDHGVDAENKQKEKTKVSGILTNLFMCRNAFFLNLLHLTVLAE